jgi:hypothetical protein
MKSVVAVDLESEYGVCKKWMHVIRNEAHEAKRGGV